MLKEMRWMQEEICELQSMFAQQKELEEKKEIILGEVTVEVLKALTQKVKEGGIKGRVILLHNDNIIPCCGESSLRPQDVNEYPNGNQTSTDIRVLTEQGTPP